MMKNNYFMKLLTEIKDAEYPVDQSTLELREAARGVFFDENCLVPILFVSKYNYHKLPGGAWNLVKSD